jgi:hypothetical protein
MTALQLGIGLFLAELLAGRGPRGQLEGLPATP